MKKIGEGAPSSLKRKMAVTGSRCKVMGFITKRYVIQSIIINYLYVLRRVQLKSSICKFALRII